MDRLFVLHDDRALAALHAFLRGNAQCMAALGRPLAVQVSEYKAKRNDRQNRLYWAVLGQIAEQGWLGGRRFSAEAWHHYFRTRFIGFEETPGGGQVPISTTTLDIAAFADYVTRVQEYAASELGLELT